MGRLHSAVEPVEYVGTTKHCTFCSSTNVEYKYLNNRKVDQPRYKCLSCMKLFTHNPSGCGRKKHPQGYGKIASNNGEALPDNTSVSCLNPTCGKVGTSKFMYYNNGRASQPRYKCGACNTAFTHGGHQRASKRNRDELPPNGLDVNLAGDLSCGSWEIAPLPIKVFGSNKKVKLALDDAHEAIAHDQQLIWNPEMDQEELYLQDSDNTNDDANIDDESCDVDDSEWLSFAELLNEESEETKLGFADLGTDDSGKAAYELEPSCEYATSEPANMDHQFSFPEKPDQEESYLQVPANTNDDENLVDESCVEDEWFKFAELLNAVESEETELGCVDLGTGGSDKAAYELEPSCEYATSEPANMDHQFSIPEKMDQEELYLQVPANTNDDENLVDESCVEDDSKWLNFAELLNEESEETELGCVDLGTDGSDKAAYELEPSCEYATSEPANMDHQFSIPEKTDQEESYLQVSANTNDDENLVDESCVEDEWFKFAELLNAVESEETELGCVDLGTDDSDKAAYELEPSCEYATCEPANMDHQFLIPEKADQEELYLPFPANTNDDENLVDESCVEDDSEWLNFAELLNEESEETKLGFADLGTDDSGKAAYELEPSCKYATNEPANMDHHFTIPEKTDQEESYLQVPANTNDDENLVDESCVEDEWSNFAKLLNAVENEEIELGHLDLGSDHGTSSSAADIPELSHVADHDSDFEAAYGLAEPSCQYYATSSGPANVDEAQDEEPNSGVEQIINLPANIISTHDGTPVASCDVEEMQRSDEEVHDVEQLMLFMDGLDKECAGMNQDLHARDEGSDREVREEPFDFQIVMESPSHLLDFQWIQ